MKIKLMLILLTFILFPTAIFSQFLNIGVGAKACAMSEAFVAIANDPSAIYWNPAGLTQLTSVEVMAAHNFWLVDMSNDFFAAVVPFHEESTTAQGEIDILENKRLSALGVWGFAVYYSNSGTITKFEDFQEVGTFKAYDIVASVSYANEFFQSFSIGASIKFIRKNIDFASATGFAADFGLLYNLNFAKIGFSISNLGTKIKFVDIAESLPMNIRFGTSTKFDKFVIAGDISKKYGDPIGGNFGFEYLIMSKFGIRFGYDSQNSYSLGLGLTTGKIFFDYSYTPYTDLNVSHQISARFKF